MQCGDAAVGEGLDQLALDKCAAVWEEVGAGVVPAHEEAMIDGEQVAETDLTNAGNASGRRSETKGNEGSVESLFGSGGKTHHPHCTGGGCGREDCPVNAHGSLLAERGGVEA